MTLGQQSNSDISELNEAQHCYIVDEQCNCSALYILKYQNKAKGKPKAAKTERTKCMKESFLQAIIFDLHNGFCHIK